MNKEDQERKSPASDGCLRCDLDRILNNQSKLIHNGVGIADMYSPDEFEIAMNRTNKA